MDSLTTLPAIVRLSRFWPPSRKANTVPAITNSEQLNTSTTSPPPPPHKVDYQPTTRGMSQKEAQTALLLSVIRATPNEVFYSIAKDVLKQTYVKVSMFVRTVVIDNLHRDNRRSRLRTDSQSAVDPTASCAQPSSTCVTCHRSMAHSRLESAEFLIMKSFVKLVIKLLLTLVLEITTVALRLLG